ncbi:MAG: hypothetical protein IK117_01075 [Bacteroidales bacterium]|nr:hypothetical protein [Bacteroidales bacterium]
MKKLILFILLLNLALTSLAHRQRSGVLMVDEYDKLYTVQLAVDTTVSIAKVFPNFETYLYKDLAPTIHTPQKVSCRYTVLFLWHAEFAISILVKPYKTIPISDLPKYGETKDIYYLAFHWRNMDVGDWEDTDVIDVVDETRSPAMYESSWVDYLFSYEYLGIRKGETVQLYKYYWMRIFRWCKSCDDNYAQYNFNIYKNICDYSFLIQHIPNESLIQRQISNSLFGYGSDLLYGRKEVLPIGLSELNRPLVYPHGLPWSENVTYDTKYVIRRKGTNEYIVSNGDKESPVEFYYIPHVLFLPTSSFKYRITSINGKSKQEFLRTYKDDFKPYQSSSEKYEFKEYKENTKKEIQDEWGERKWPYRELVPRSLKDNNLGWCYNTLYDTIYYNLGRNSAKIKENNVVSESVFQICVLPTTPVYDSVWNKLFLIKYLVSKKGNVYNISIDTDTTDVCSSSASEVIEAVKNIKYTPAKSPYKDEPVNTKDSIFIFSQGVQIGAFDFSKKIFDMNIIDNQREKEYMTMIDNVRGKINKPQSLMGKSVTLNVIINEEGKIVYVERSNFIGDEITRFKLNFASGYKDFYIATMTEELQAIGNAFKTLPNITPYEIEGKKVPVKITLPKMVF